MTDARNNILTGNIMDYKRKYGEALERARTLHKLACETSHKNTRMAIEELFPEIKDSEDEGIKRCIGMCLTDATEQRFEEFNTTIKDCLAWLEKQGEHQEYPKDVIDNAISFLANRNDGMPEEEAKDIVNAIITVLNPCYWPKRVEQKPADKVEPKFKVGDWICSETRLIIGRVTSFDGEFYYYITSDGFENAINVSNINNYHLWTIQDAKVGDVLYTSSSASNEVFIFKELSKEGNIKCYCSYDSEDKYCEGEYHFIGKPDFTTHPATKEKYELLFQKIKEAGYEWNAEKKELKKIEQKPADKVEPKFKVGDIIRLKDSLAEYVIESISGGYYHGKGWGLSIDCDEDYELVEQKPVWSEEDEKMWSTISDLLWEGYKLSDEKVSWDKIRCWLLPKIKSLKERMKGE